MQRSSHRNIPNLLSTLIFIFLMGFLVTCTPPMQTYRLYEGPQLPSDETAYLLCKGEPIRINSVNGMKSPDGKDTFGNVTLEILPGDYNLTVSFSGRSMTVVQGGGGRYSYNIFYRHDSTNNVDLTMKAEAGHTYVVTSTHDYSENRWHAVVRDETDDRRIIKEGPHSLNKIRRGDNQDVKRIYRQ